MKWQEITFNDNDIQVVDNDVSKNAEFSLRLEPVSTNSEGVFYIYPETALGKTPVIIR